jgi:hypothetical protein
VGRAVLGEHEVDGVAGGGEEEELKGGIVEGGGEIERPEEVEVASYVNKKV